jgi:ubiquitin C-terminal hydrolase
MEIINSGIANPGNFCYINSCIQCLRHIKPIINLINNNTEFDAYIHQILGLLEIKAIVNAGDIKAKVSKLKENPDAYDTQISQIIEAQHSTQDEFAFMLDKVEKESYKIYLYVGLRNLLIQLIQTTNKTVDAGNFYRLCNFVTRGTGMDHIVNGGQNDCVEYLMCILDYLHDSHSIPVKADINPEILQIAESELELQPLPKRIKYGLIKDIHMRYSKSYTTFNRELYFYNLNMVQCGKCEYVSLNYSPYNVLCLPIINDKPSTIYDCLDKMFCKEALDTEYKCEKCKNTAGNTIEKKILTKPNTLIICLKRFDFKMMPGGFGMPVKINAVIEYPHVLNIGKYYPIIPGDENENIYKLVGVINHIGLMNYGHYFSYCYDEGKECWFNYNDQHVTKLDTKDVINNPNAYVLFYEKI